MSILKKPSIRQLPSFKKTKIHGLDINFKIDSNIKSVDIESIFFTNFFKKDKVKYRFVKKEIGIIKRNDNPLENYEMKEENYNKKNQARIKQIYSETYRAVNVTPLIRLKHINSKEFQLYCQEINGDYVIKLIDLHHLIVPAADKDHGEEKANPQKKYKEVKGGSIDLKDLV